MSKAKKKPTVAAVKAAPVELPQLPENPFVSALASKDGYVQYGVTLRDYLAGVAMAGIVAKSNLPHTETASQAYRIADAMLGERQSKRTA